MYMSIGFWHITNNTAVCQILLRSVMKYLSFYAESNKNEMVVLLKYKNWKTASFVIQKKHVTVEKIHHNNVKSSHEQWTLNWN